MLGKILAVCSIVLCWVTSVDAQTQLKERAYESLRRELTDKLQASGTFSSITVINSSTLKATTLGGSAIVVPLDAVAADIARAPTRRADIVSDFVSRLVSTAKPRAVATTRSEFIASLRVVIRADDYLAQQPGGPLTSQPIVRPFAGRARAFVAIDRGEKIEIAATGAGRDHGFSDDELFELGREQLKRYLAHVETEDAGGIRAMTLSDDAYAPSLLLLDEPWAKVAADFGPDFVVAIPDRDTLLVASSRHALHLRKAVDLVAQSRKTAPLIGEILQRRGRGWSPYAGP